MIEITVSDVLKNCDVKLLIGREDEKINECYIDSKKKTNCGCFIGIKGEKTDGSLFYKEAFDKLQMIRFLDDWAYQANVRGKIKAPCNIKNLMQPYENKLAAMFNCNKKFSYSYPWNRKFEIEVSIQ